MKIYLILLVLSCTACSTFSPAKYNIENREVHIRWETTKNINTFCAKLSNIPDSQLKAKNIQIIACSSSIGDTCTIYTDEELTLEILGHEVRHCFEGAWHPSTL